MGSALIAGRFLLAAVFGVAAMGKLLDLAGSREALTGFGVREDVAAVAGTALPLAELLTVVLLLVEPTAVVGAVLALLLLLAFIVGIGNALRKGEAPECHCFGAIHSEPVGRGQIIRNAVLASVALFVMIGGDGPSINGWVGARSAAELVAVLAVIAALTLAAIAVTQRGLIRRLRLELAELEARTAGLGAGLARGTVAPAFAMPGPGGDFVSLDSLTAVRKPVMLIFVSAGCGPCESLLDEFSRWRETMADDLTIGILGAWTIERYAAVQAEGGGTVSLGDARVLDDELDAELVRLVEVFESYKLRATPSAVVVSAEGRIDSATVNGRPAIEALLRLTLDHSPGHRAQLGLGEPAGV